MGEHRVCGFRPEELHVAFVDLHYDEGFPTFLDGDPFWTMLKYEPSEAYQALVQYLYMSGTQTIKPETEELVQDTDAEPSVASGMRSISQLASQLDTNTSTVLVTQAKLKRWAILYYWDWRARAYDMFRLVQHRSQQEIRAIETQDSHYLIAKKLTQRALDFMENDADFLDMLTPKVAIDLIKLGTSLERISAGLPAAGPANEAVLGVVSAQLSLQRVANNSQTSDDVVDITKDSAILDAALNDPKQTEYLQKFILSIQMGGS